MFWLLVLISDAHAGCVSLSSVLSNLNHDRIDRSTHMITVKQNNVVAASVVYRYLSADRRILSIDSAQTTKEYRGRGEFSGLFQEMLRREPQVTEIESTLMQDNLRIAQENDDGVGSSSERCTRMVTFTPAYRSRARFGFGRIIECTITGFGIILRVAR